MAAEHGTRSRYNSGCRCDLCKQAERDYQTDRKSRRAAQKSPAETKPSKVAVLRGTTQQQAPQHSPVTEYGPVETAIRKQLAELSTVDARGGEAEMAYYLAGLMDNQKTPATAQVQASRQLTELIDRLRKGADKKTGKLASVRRMTRPESATG
ncbi:hypothetical protein H7J86_24500 [Mycobacterium hackensackense]|uniref:hypothetical protein n=1 Tax=Mycobacterium hackensackense TaxID=228909 RepID=UPI002265C36F|nr:hypothetical protein [Mycobacterium hackensackense]MCV7255328.1 hypothetical protein [Mycobacterium hackensackense]